MANLHLHACRVRNFRGLRDAHFDFSHVTVLIGENDCGRTSLLNALEACLGRRSTTGAVTLTARDFHRAGPGHPFTGPIAIEVHLRETHAPGPQPSWIALRRAGLAHPDGRLDFALVVEAHPAPDGTPVTRVRFVGPRPYGGNPADDLDLVRAAVPFLRIRAAVLRPAPWTEGATPDPEAAARTQVDWEIRQAFEEVLETPGNVSDQTLDQVRAAVASAVSTLRGVEERAHGGTTNLVHDPTTWSRVAGLLAGRGARSVATLAFVESLLESRGPDGLHPDARAVVSLEDPEAYLHPMTLASVWGLIQRLPAQKIVATNSSDMLQAFPLESVRRLVRNPHGHVSVFQVPENAMSPDEIRRVTYHLRALRGNTLFMRFWLLVEGETEFWILPEAAHAMGVDLMQEGIGCIGFAQCGVGPLARLANHLGIDWHLLADGDRAGTHYGDQARSVGGRGAVTVLQEADLEHCLWDHGYEGVFRSAAEMDDSAHASEVIERAIRRVSKPRLAVLLGEAMARRGTQGVPPALRRLLTDALERARQSHLA